MPRVLFCGQDCIYLFHRSSWTLKCYYCGIKAATPTLPARLMFRIILTKTLLLSTFDIDCFPTHQPTQMYFYFYPPHILLFFRPPTLAHLVLPSPTSHLFCKTKRAKSPAILSFSNIIAKFNAINLTFDFTYYTFGRHYY
jgi:hypothetical protein